uniref:Uncharacterized protein n=1 Tax=Arundo donax TaxID=35708 RepID=A0A0A9BTS7_ARUDO
MPFIPTSSANASIFLTKLSSKRRSSKLSTSSSDSSAT